jgi:hypothetical protein
MGKGKKFVCSVVVVLAIVGLFMAGCGPQKGAIVTPKVYRQDHIERVAVLPFGNVVFTDKMIEKLVEHSKWQVIDRANLDRILEEQNLQRTTQFDDETAVAFGKLAGVDLVIFGDYRGHIMTVTSKAVDIETAEYLAYNVTNVGICYEEDIDCQAELALTNLLPHRFIGKKGKVEFNPKPKRKK